MKKRAFDITVISLAAVAWVPVVLISAVAVLLLSGRPILYKSRRWVGPGSAIDMAKLRVMVPDASKHTAATAAGLTASDGGRFLNMPSDSPLYTPVGRWLDRLGLNEIPQFVHVLSGKMSIVGARPLTDSVRDSLVARHGFIDDRWLTPAGLTGLPQLVGRAGLTDTQRLQLEAAYSRAVSLRYSFWRDFLILLYTVLITFGIKKPMTYDSAIAMVQRRRRSRVHEVATAMPYAAAAAADADAVA